VEDSPAFYSSYLPLLYTEVMAQTRFLMAERLNEREVLYRRRARPKIILARTYEEAEELFDRYQKYLLGIISDVSFWKNGAISKKAGIDLVARARRENPDIPVLLQSANSDHSEVAEDLDVAFADKGSPDLLSELRQFMLSNLGFGPFVFRLPDGEEVDQADGMEEMAQVLRRVPGASLRYHGERNHFSNWLMARSEFALSQAVRPVKVSDFSTDEDLRSYMIEEWSTFLDRRQRGEIAEFARGTNPLTRDFTRIGQGSMGGKARGSAFMNQMLVDHPIHDKYPGIKIVSPRSAALCTDVFDEFCHHYRLAERALEAESDEAIARLFLSVPLDRELMADLESILTRVRYPLAVRSSSLHEDSEVHPLAGLYKTYILPNSSPSLETRLEHLSQAIRLVYASTYFQGPRAYLDAHSMRLREEKMAVIIQRVVGRRHKERFYPDFAGVAQSFNYYPFRHLRPDDGIASVCLGLGQTVVEGRRALRFSPRHPQILPQMTTPSDILRNSQREFFALSMVETSAPVMMSESANLVRLDLNAAAKDGTLEAVGATYSPDNNAVYDTVYRTGVPIVNFAGVLKHGRFPLAPLLCDLLDLGEDGMGTSVEMEFAAALHPEEPKPEMAVVQLRPLGVRGHQTEVDLDAAGQGRRPFLAGAALGNGIIGGIQDVVYVHPKRFDVNGTPELAVEIGRLNARLAKERRPYMLLGPGRWGTADRWLGVPVVWEQVSGARVIVELEVPQSHIDPSLGAHFVHNITSLHIGYFCLNMGSSKDVVDLDFLESLPSVEERLSARHVRLPEPVAAYLDGRIGKGLVVTQTATEDEVPS
jgi:hypothetical protein